MTLRIVKRGEYHMSFGNAWDHEADMDAKIFNNGDKSVVLTWGVDDVPYGWVYVFDHTYPDEPVSGGAVEISKFGDFMNQFSVSATLLDDKAHLVICTTVHAYNYGSNKYEPSERRMYFNVFSVDWASNSVTNVSSGEVPKPNGTLTWNGDIRIAAAGDSHFACTDFHTAVGQGRGCVVYGFSNNWSTIAQTGICFGLGAENTSSSVSWPFFSPSPLHIVHYWGARVDAIGIWQGIPSLVGTATVSGAPPFQYGRQPFETPNGVWWLGPGEGNANQAYLDRGDQYGINLVPLDSPYDYSGASNNTIVDWAGHANGVVFVRDQWNGRILSFDPSSLERRTFPGGSDLGYAWSHNFKNADLAAVDHTNDGHRVIAVRSVANYPWADHYIAVLEEIEVPVVVLTRSPTGTISKGAPVTFSVAGSTGAIKRITLDFGDGTPLHEFKNIDGNGKAVAYVPSGASTRVHSYDESGPYTVTAAAYGPGGTEHRTTMTVTVRPSPVAALSATPSSTMKGQLVTLDAAGSHYYDDLEFDFGDGSTKLLLPGSAGMPNPVSVATHRFLTSGQYTVTLKAIAGSATATATKLITITDTPWMAAGPKSKAVVFE